MDDYNLSLMDEHSLTVVYDPNRGEPRKEIGKKGNFGDCVNCSRCVQVCPTGIDIRDGVQMECIACTACIDACDAVMEKINKPKGLIRYDTEQALEKKKTKWVRLRVIIYSIILIIATSGLSYVVSYRDLLKVNVVRSKETPFQTINQGQRIINHFKLNVRNQYDQPIFITFVTDETITEKGNITLTSALNPLKLSAQSSIRTDLFVSFDANFFSFEKSKLPIQAIVNANEEGTKLLNTFEYEVPLIAPLP